MVLGELFAHGQYTLSLGDESRLYLHGLQRTRRLPVRRGMVGLHQLDANVSMYRDPADRYHVLQQPCAEKTFELVRRHSRHFLFIFCKAFASLLLWQVRGMYRVQFKKNYFRTCYDCRHQVPISHICLILNITFILKLGEIVILILTDNVPQEEEKEEEGKGGKSEG